MAPLKPRTAEPDLASAVMRLAENMKALHQQQLQTEKIAIFIDNASLCGFLSRQSRDLGRKFRLDHHKLLTAVAQSRFLIDTFCFSCFDEDKRPAGFENLLEKAGITSSVVLSRSQLASNLINRMREFANRCVRCDTIILVSGDGQYGPPMRCLHREFGVRTEVAFWRNEMSNTLVASADRIIDLDALRQQIELETFLE